MPTRVYKYFIHPENSGGHVTILMPAGSKALHFGIFQNQMCVWAETPETSLTVNYHFTVVETGFDVPPDHKYVGTAFQDSFAWHLYQELVSSHDN